LVPSDMDMVLRLDVRRFRDATGPDAERSLQRIWHELLLDAGGADPESHWLRPAVASTDVLWLGCRLGRAGCKDFVLVLRGKFVDARAGYGFGIDEDPRDLGGGWLSYTRLAPKRRPGRVGEARASVARVYVRPPELAVLVSSAEVDSAERSVEQSLSQTSLVPSESGLVSVIVRSRALAESLRARSQKAAEWLAESERVEIRIEPQAAGTLATFAVTFAEAARAERAAQALKILVLALLHFDRRLSTNDVSVDHVGTDVVLRLKMAAGASNPPLEPAPESGATP
jgi:hypothetical protein